MNTKQIIYLGVGVLVLGLVIGGSFFAGKTLRGTEGPTPTPTLTETPTPAATDTPVGTPTPTKKPTPTPSNTQAPTPTPTPGVVNIEASVNPTNSTACSQKFTFSAKIYTNAAMTVKYKWIRSDNATSSEQTLTYSGAGNQTVTEEWTLGQASGNTYNGWERIEITSPGSALSNKAEFTLSCP